MEKYMKDTIIMSELDITQIPTIMRHHNWINGAKLMEKWFKAPSNSNPKAGLPSTDIIKMDWVLKYPRARQVYDTMLREKVWMNSAAKNEIISMLRKKQLLVGTRKAVGTPKHTLPIVDKDAIQFRTVGGGWDMAFGEIDDLRAALANFVFKVIIIGEVEPVLNAKKLPSGKYQLTINEIGIYVRDSYDFNDPPGEDQELGNWDIDDDSVGRTVFNGGETVKNSDFRAWRTAHSSGGDFLVFSDIKYIKLNPADSFIFTK